MMYILIEVGINGIRTNELVANTKAEIEQYLKDKGYYFSKKAGRYIDDKTVKIYGGSGIDYEIHQINLLTKNNNSLYTTITITQP